MTTISSPVPMEVESSPATTPALAKAPRVTSIDAARGFVMLTMIFVNDLAGADEKIVPWWMKHYSDIKPAVKVHDGMTFVDLVFPGFLFIMGMSIPFALGGRLKRRESPWRVFGHVVVRTISLLALGILMVNGESGPNSAPGMSRNTWTVLMFCGAILAFVDLRPWFVKRTAAGGWDAWRIVTVALRGIGVAGLIVLALVYTQVGHRRGLTTTSHILTLWPFSIRTGWYGILGLIGWAYLAGATLFLIFRTQRLALAVCTALLLGSWVAESRGAFDHFALPGLLAPVGEAIAWVVGKVNQYVSLGEALGSLAAITTAGVLLATILVTPETAKVKERVRFTLLFIGGTALAAMMLHPAFFVWKNDATPPWCLWAMAITAGVWLAFYVLGDVLGWKWLSKPFAVAGENVLLAYLFSEMMESVMGVVGGGDFYDHLAGPTLGHAVGRSLGIGVVLLAVTAGLNRVGFRLKL